LKLYVHQIVQLAYLTRQHAAAVSYSEGTACPWTADCCWKCSDPRDHWL